MPVWRNATAGPLHFPRRSSSSLPLSPTTQDRRKSKCRQASLYAPALRSALVPDPERSSLPSPPAGGSFVRKIVRWTVGIFLVALVLAAGLLWLSNRKFATDRTVIRASRMTSGNRIFPVQVAVFQDRVARYKPSLLGHTEDSITLRQIASVKVQAGPVFADVVIDTTGGSPPVVVHGLWKKDAVTLSGAIAAAQAASPMPVRPVATPTAVPAATPPG